MDGALLLGLTWQNIVCNGQTNVWLAVIFVKRKTNYLLAKYLLMGKGRN